jgi:hypothetical protein
MRFRWTLFAWANHCLAHLCDTLYGMLRTPSIHLAAAIGATTALALTAIADHRPGRDLDDILQSTQLLMTSW